MKPAATETAEVVTVREGTMPSVEEAPQVKLRENVIREVAVGDLLRAEFNPRRSGLDDASIEELAASVKEHGVLLPILAREHPSEAGKLQIVAGERRWRAARLAGLATVPVTVRPLSDREAVELTVTENLQRRDLHPLEEGRGVASMLAMGWSLDEAAAHLGKSRKWVARRASIARLTDAWQAAVGDPGSPFAGWSAAALEVVAPLPADMQGVLLARWQAAHPRLVAGWTADVVAQQVGEHLHVINRAPFDPDDRHLVRAAGACATCPKRSDREPELFADFHDAVSPGLAARCLDGGCWAGKIEATIAARNRMIRERQGQTVLIRGDGDYGSRPLVGVPDADRGRVLVGHAVEDANQGEPGAIEAIIVSGADAGRGRWIKPRAGQAIKGGVVVDVEREDEGPGAEPADRGPSKVAVERTRRIEEEVGKLLENESTRDALASETHAMVRVVLACEKLAHGLDEAEIGPVVDELNGIRFGPLYAELAAYCLRRLGGLLKYDYPAAELAPVLLMARIDVAAVTARVHEELPLPGEGPAGSDGENPYALDGLKPKGLPGAKYQGWEAGRGGVGIDGNPYVKGQYKQAWEEGWRAARGAAGPELQRAGAEAHVGGEG